MLARPLRRRTRCHDRCSCVVVVGVGVVVVILIERSVIFVGKVVEIVDNRHEWRCVGKRWRGGCTALVVTAVRRSGDKPAREGCERAASSTEFCREREGDHADIEPYRGAQLSLR